MSEQIRVGVIGLGFMGATHVRAYEAANDDGFDCPLVAVCDADPQRRSGRVAQAGNIDTGSQAERLFNPDAVAAYEHADELLADSRVDLVSICTHTDSHVELSIRALEAGKHVLVEKPLATTGELARPLLDAARNADRVCIPAMCMRFWPAWAQIRDWIEDCTHGLIRSASFTRLGSRPAWAADFYHDTARSGGALVDLHIHDVDFVYACLGSPARLSSSGSSDHVVTTFTYEDGPTPVVCEGGWDQRPGFPFTMRCTVNFEHATADFDLARADQLLLCRDGHAEPIELPPQTGYDMEIRHTLRVIRGEEPPGAAIEDAVRVLEILDAERESLATGLPVSVRPTGA